MKKSNTLEDQQSNVARLEHVKEEFGILFEEIEIWIDETREDTLSAELFNFSWRAAEFAAVLGFDRPPCEHEPLVPLHDYCRFDDIRKQAEKTRIWIHPPYGHHGFAFGFTWPLSEALISQCDGRLHAELRAWIGRWKRALRRVDSATVQPASSTLVHYMHSLEADTFEEQRIRELAGDRTSFYVEMTEQLADVFRIAALKRLSPEQRGMLIAERARSTFNEAARRRRELANGCLRPAEPTAAPIPVVGPGQERESRESLRSRAEEHVKQVCGGIFPGVRPLARALGCEKRLSSLNNAIRSSKYLRARQAEYDADRKATCREKRLTETHLDSVRQSTEPDPLEALIEEQAADRRDDERLARIRAPRRSQ
jgi:hypothetical protein